MSILQTGLVSAGTWHQAAPIGRGDSMNADAKHSGAWLAGTFLGLWVAGTLIWWGLAFPPWVRVPAPWLARVQEICFGTDQNGQLSAYGWGALVAGPLGMLLTMLAGWGADLRLGVRGLLRSLAGRLTLATFLLALASEGLWVGMRLVETEFPTNAGNRADVAEPLPPTYPRLNRPVPDFRLVDAQGIPRTPRSYSGRLVLLTFAYGHCTTICPVTLATVAGAATSLAPLNPAIVIITLDAWRDTPSTLQGLLTRWGMPPSAALLTGDPVAVGRTLDAFNVASTRNEKTGDIDHVALVYVIDPQGRIAYALSAPTKDWVVEAALRSVSALPAGPGGG
jgi:protein SCO1/2